MTSSSRNNSAPANVHCVWLLISFLIFICCSPDVRADDNVIPLQPVVFQVNFENQQITPATARFIARAIREAEEAQVQCLIIVLDTPGGLVDSTRSIVKSILQSRVCVVVFVAPKGVAHAASAGGFITLSAHIAAMAPGTENNTTVVFPMPIDLVKPFVSNDTDTPPRKKTARKR